MTSNHDKMLAVNHARWNTIMNAYTRISMYTRNMFYDFICMHYHNIMWPTINEPSRRRF
jgi:hypothetical protein